MKHVEEVQSQIDRQPARKCCAFHKVELDSDTIRQCDGEMCVGVYKKNYMHLNLSRSSIWNFIVNRARWKKIKNKTDTKVQVLFLAIWHTQQNSCDAKRKKFDSLINDNPLFGFALLKTVSDTVLLIE